MAKDTRPPRDILTHVIDARVALVSVMYGLSDAQLSATGAVGRWSVKNLLAHMGKWEEVCLGELQKHVRGQEPGGSYRDSLWYNDQWEGELQALSLLESIAFFETAHARLLLFLGGLADEQWDGYVRAWVGGATWHHFEEHGAEIRAWRERAC
ncbi:MAG TPA: DinB family protein [Ktedonobacteraceae bacterium]